MAEIGIYARVSTTDQDPQRQLAELRRFAKDTYDEPDIRSYTDIISGTKTDRGEEYQRLRSDIEDGVLDIVIVHELSRLSRLGAGEIHEFLEFCLSHETGIQDLEVGLEISLDDDLVDRAVSQLIAGVMGDLARVEHKQKLRRIQSGIDAAKEAGRWTGRPPAGFDVEDGYLQVNADECDALMIDNDSTSDTMPYMEIQESKVDVAHEATVGKIGDEDVFYLQSRGLDDDDAKQMIVAGFIEPITEGLPIEYAVELNRLIELEMEGSLG
jgi:DNA invertase Pin-like site-specific DNA recombinase